MRRTIVTALVGLLSVTAPRLAEAASPEYCAPTVDMDPLQLLRQVSLDLRGRVPTYEEYEQVRDSGDAQAAVDEIVDGMFQSEDYFEEIHDYHQSMLWGSLDTSLIPNLYASRQILQAAGGIWRLPFKRKTYRGSITNCLDQEQTESDANGRPIPIETYQDPNCTDGMCRKEGYVWVEPFWAPGTEVKVCAYDAQQMPTGQDNQLCSDYCPNDPLCGCGPNMQRCGPNNGAATDHLRAQLAEEPSRLFEWIVREGRSYLEAFTTTTIVINGPTSHFYRYLAGSPTKTAGGGAVTYEMLINDVPELPYDDVDTWVPVERDAPHAGAFTTLSYLVRFPSNRARANRFATAFYCEPFIPKEEGLPPEEADPSPNLRARPGCNDCHERLEPLASHWGRWRTGGKHGFLYPEIHDIEQPRDECICGEGTNRNCNEYCNKYYVTADNSSAEEFELYQGRPQAASWLSDQERTNIDRGLVNLVDTDQEQDRLALCSVRNFSEHLLGRQIEANDLAWLQEHAEAFQASGYDFSAMVQRLINDPRYRMIR